MSITYFDFFNNDTGKEKIDSIVEELKLSQYDKILLNLKAIKSDDELILDDELEKGANNLTLRKRLPFGINILETDRILKNKEKDMKKTLFVSALLAGFISLNANASDYFVKEINISLFSMLWLIALSIRLHIA